MNGSSISSPTDVQQREANDVKWFAGLAMQAIISQHDTVPDSDSMREEIALWSFRMGQAMVATSKRLHVAEESARPTAKE